MFAEWVTIGVSWGIKVASMFFTLLMIIGLVIGLFSLGAMFLKGGDDNGTPKDRQDDKRRPDRSGRTKTSVRVDGIRRNDISRTGTRISYSERGQKDVQGRV